jgi:beta-phosphoglucomutase-like phosphatase (HAD superfamily)
MTSIVLMDFDDVLISMREPRIDALRRALHEDAIELNNDLYDSLADGLSFAGGVRAIYRWAGKPDDETGIELAALRAGDFFSDAVHRAPRLAPGARDFVLRAAGQARLGIVTRAERRHVEPVLRTAELGDAFECVITADEYAGPEPSSEPFSLALTRLSRRGGSRAGEEIALVASLHAVAASRSAGMLPVVVGPVASPVAFAGNGYLATLEGASIADVLRISMIDTP